MRLNLLFGFLGSGKTTLARRILTGKSAGEKVAIIVNEFGDVGIDGAILEGRNVDMIELTSGCLCCTLKGSLLNAVEELRDKAGAQRIVVEATGVAQPEELIETFADPSFGGRYDIGPIVTVVDAPKYLKLMALLGEFYGAQVRNADVVILNKVDLAPAAALEDVRRAVSDLNSAGEILFAERCDVDLGRLLDGPSSRVVKDYRLARGQPAETPDHAPDHGHGHDHNHGHDHDHRHPPAQSFVLDAGGDAARHAIETFFHALPENIWRAKGFMSVDGQPHLIQFTMGQLEISPADPKPIRNMVFIGAHMDRNIIERQFAAVRAASMDRALPHAQGRAS